MPLLVGLGLLLAGALVGLILYGAFDLIRGADDPLPMIEGVRSLLPELGKLVQVVFGAVILFFFAWLSSRSRK